MEDFIARANIALFKERLLDAKDEKERALLKELLVAAEAKLTQGLPFNPKASPGFDP